MSSKIIMNFINTIKQYKDSIGLGLSMISIALVFIVGSTTNSLANTSNTLQEQSNILQKQLIDIENNITNLQHEIHKITHFNTTIIGGEDFIYLESIYFQYSENGTLNYVILRGNLSTTINIFSPHYGRAKIIITNFTRTKEIYRKGTDKYTNVDFVRQPQYLYTYQGLNVFEVDIPLACRICPIEYLIPPPGKSTPEFIIGILDFKIIFYDVQTLNSATYGFSSEVHGIINMPIS